MDCFELAWNEWFETEHKYAISDKSFYETLIQPYTCFVGIYIKLKQTDVEFDGETEYERFWHK